MIGLFTKSFGDIRQYLLDRCTHEPSLVTVNDILAGLRHRLENDPVREVLGPKLEHDIRELLRETGVIGAITLDCVPATEALATDVVVDGHLQGAMRHDKMAWLLGAVPLQISDARRREIDQLLAELKRALVRQPSDLCENVKQWRAENIAQGVNLLMVSALCGHVRPAYAALGWLNMATRTTVYGPIPQGTYHLWRVYV